MKKIISTFIAMSMMLMSVNVFASGFSWPESYDMTNVVFPNTQVINQCREEGHVNYGVFKDPTDSTNDVYGIRLCDTANKYADMRMTMNYTTSATEADFDVYREDASNVFEMKLIASAGGASGNTVNLFKMDASGNVLVNGKSVTTYTANTWYNVRILSSQAKTYHEVYFKKATDDEYYLIGTIAHDDYGFDTVGTLNYFFKNYSTEFTYLDNMNWKELGYDIKQKVHYDFNNTVSKTGSLYSLAINSANMTWSTEQFDGETTLKAKMNATSALEAANWEDIPNMDKVYVEANMGFNGDGDDAANLPFQFGIRPVFAQEDGTKSAAARNNQSDGIRFAYSRHVLLEGNVQDKTQGASLSNSKLYKTGYVYDRTNKVLKAYFIAGNGKTFVYDASSNQYAQAQRYLAGIKLYQRASGSYMTGAGYYDYLYIDEAEGYTKKHPTLQTVKQRSQPIL